MKQAKIIHWISTHAHPRTKSNPTLIEAIRRLQKQIRTMISEVVSAG
jgi:hypothetical protein